MINAVDVKQYILWGREERYLEYKAPMLWTRADTKVKIAKAMMALSNLRGGGVIVVGMKEIKKGVWEPDTMTDEQVASFTQDHIAQFINNYAIPAVQFTVERFSLDTNKFVIIKVREFDSFPTICRGQIPKRYMEELKGGAIYYRSNLKIESAPISSVEDMRELVTLTVNKGLAREIERLRVLGLIGTSPSLQEDALLKYKQERQGLDNVELLTQIQSRGYWRVEIHPTEYKDKRFTNAGPMQDLLSSATESLRGWPYPFLNTAEVTYSGKWLEGQVNREHLKEYWRLYESGQWLHFRGLTGAWIPREILFSNRFPLPPQHAGYIHIRNNILYTLTEILHFAVGLAQSGLFEPSAFLSIQLHNTLDYMLVEDFERVFFAGSEYVNKQENPIQQEVSIPIIELPAVADQIALQTTTKMVQVFGWFPSDAGVRMLTEDQTRFIERRA